MKNVVLFAAVILVAAGAGVSLQQYLSTEDELQLVPEEAPRPKFVNVVGQPRPEFAFKDTEEQMRHMKEWDNKVVLVNFWATWCPPCKKEMPAFIELQEKYADKNFQIIGVALDDPDSVRNFADTLGVNYPLMIAEYEGIELARAYGNHMGALPYSVFVGKDGIIKKTKAGEMSKQQVEKIILPLL